MKVGIFLERDGVLTTARTDRSPTSLAEFHVNQDAAPVLKKLKDAGFILIVTTNQPGLSQGTLPRRELDRMHDLLRRELPIDDLLLCPHEESDQCPCRKPKPGLFQEARFKWQLDLERSFVVSDKWQDAVAARACGCTSVLIESKWIGHVHRDFLVPDLAAAANKILQLHCIGTVTA
ncbi:MAG TPA: HAD-IIIA family hydrolase [Verrucomicrobia bacterium]|nr:HAD-IIIA family hydrolase [Verrucomicrobiota bacterium]HOB32289.1 HAD-IIIA family hydrolase [Verrucomicrobiota bacterium]HOP97361.1 HAD-IIIA family hydrolase [Verrucomicrobiota bacterium]